MTGMKCDEVVKNDLNSGVCLHEIRLEKNGKSENMSNMNNIVAEMC